MSKNVTVIFIILAIALVSRLIVFFHVYHQDPLRMMAPDSISYERPALALLKTGRYDKSLEQTGKPEVRRTPGYPILIAGVYGVFGQSRPTLMILQIMMSVATIGLLYCVAHRWFGHRAALFAAALLALDPASFLSSQTMLSETPFALVFLLSIGAAIKLIEPGSCKWRWALMCGMALAISAHIRPIAYYMIIPILALAAIAARQTGVDWKRIALHSAVMMIPWLALVGGWQARNWRVAGQADYSYLRNDVMLFYSCAHIAAMRDQVSFAEAQGRIRSQLPDTTGWPDARINQLHYERSLEIIKNHPGLFVRACLTGAVNILMSPVGRPLREYLGMNHEFSPIRELRSSLGQFMRRMADNPGAALLMAGELAFMATLWLGFAAAMGIVMRRQQSLWIIHALLLGMILYMIVMPAGSQTTYRFRVPVMPLLCLYAAIGWNGVWERRYNRWRHGRLDTSTSDNGHSGAAGQE